MTRAQGRSRTVTTTTTTTTTKRAAKRAADGPGRPRGAGAIRQDDERPGPRGTGAVKSEKPDKTVRDQPSYSSVILRVHEIRCIDTTKEIDKDEMVLAAVKVEGTLGGSQGRRRLSARAQRGEQLSVGKFTKGHKQTYPKSRPLATYDAGGKIGSDPRFYLGALVLIEEDEGNIGAVINSTVNAVEQQVTSAISTAAGTAAGAALAGVASGAAVGSTVPIVGTAIGAVVGAAVGVALGEIKAAHADDVFPLKRVELELPRFPDEPGEIAGSRQTISFKGFKGHYDVTISWAVR